MVKILDNETPETLPTRGTLKWSLTASLVSYCGYLLVGLWCLHIEFEDAAKEEQGMLVRGSEDYVEPVLELGIALGLIVFAICRLGLLGIFFFETDENINTLSTIWLAFSTIFMMIIYLGTCVEIKVFAHAHWLVPGLIFVCISLDFVANVIVLCRKSAFQ